MMERVKGEFRLGKREKLRLKTLVEGLFAEGESLYDFPLRMSYRVLSPSELESSFRCGTPEGIGRLQMLITVPKRKRKRAVDRVLLRRRIREAYRLNRGALRAAVEQNPEIATLSMAFVFIHSDNADYALIEKKMKRLLHKLEERIRSNSEKSIDNIADATRREDSQDYTSAEKRSNDE